MALKKRNKVEAGFSMSSMTDIIFLLLLFFVIASTMTTPNDIKIDLPKSSSKSSTRQVVAKVSIDKDGNYFIGNKKNKSIAVSSEMLEEYLLEQIENDTATYISLYADGKTPHQNVVKVLDIAKRNKMKLVVATSYQTHKETIDNTEFENQEW